jgi:hypothetical protein
MLYNCDMTNVERLYPGHHWAEPLEGMDLEVDGSGGELRITGRPPMFLVPQHSTDLIQEYENHRKPKSHGKSRVGTETPDVSFANATTDEKLIAFVRRFGPVVAKNIIDTRFFRNKETDEPDISGELIAIQDMQELRNEQAAFRAAFQLVLELHAEFFDADEGLKLMQIIATNIQDWPRQWLRERSSRGVEPEWKLSTKGFERVLQATADLASSLAPTRIAESKTDWPGASNPESVTRRPIPEEKLSEEARKKFSKYLVPVPKISREGPPIWEKVSCRLVICELVNAFPELVFLHPHALHSSIEFGIRPLLYMLLRREFLNLRVTASCNNTYCKNFFNLERAGQKFCSAECSRRQRQRDHWQKSGKKRRKERLKRQEPQRRKPRASSERYKG